ncbi:MAG: hypothetical protein R3C56_18285 [Pirellulaceae bacterium]
MAVQYAGIADAVAIEPSMSAHGGGLTAGGQMRLAWIVTCLSASVKH